MSLRSRYKGYRQRRKVYRQTLRERRRSRRKNGSGSFKNKKMMKWLFIIGGVAVVWFGFLKGKIGKL